MNLKHYVVATIRPWNLAVYRLAISRLPGVWHLVEDPADLTPERLEVWNPRYVFFPHWSQKVPEEIVRRWECVGFHETDVPWGRGGSPIQNLIARGHKETVISALRMVDELDAGPVYAKRPLSLLGLAEEIYLRAAETVAEMIADIAEREPDPEPQAGKPTVFRRRTPEESRIPEETVGLEALFDRIRMLDAEGYPRAFVLYGGFRFEFSRPALRTGRIEATATITCEPPKGENP